MVETSLDTLFLPLEMKAYPIGSKTLFLGAKYHVFLKNLNDVHCVQPFKPAHDALTLAGFQSTSYFPNDESYDLILIHCPKQVEEAQFWIAHALSHLNIDGHLLIAANNDAGGKRLEGWLSELNMKTESLSKHKARVVWGVRPKSLPQTVIETWIAQGGLKHIDFTNEVALKSQSGLFSWNKVDKGSAFLIEHFPQNLKGIGADFGAGIGVLSYAALIQKHTIECMYVVEADARALALARENLAPVAADTKLNFHWHDLSLPVPNIPPLDFVIMNPPFHTGKQNNINLGVQFIQNAAYNLRKGGVLTFVANIHLPYEQYMQTYFSSYKILAQKDGFKIIQGVK